MVIQSEAVGQRVPRPHHLVGSTDLSSSLVQPPPDLDEEQADGEEKDVGRRREDGAELGHEEVDACRKKRRGVCSASLSSRVLSMRAPFHGARRKRGGAWGVHAAHARVRPHSTARAPRTKNRRPEGARSLSAHPRSRRAPGDCTSSMMEARTRSSGIIWRRRGVESARECRPWPARKKPPPPPPFPPPDTPTHLVRRAKRRSVDHHAHAHAQDHGGRRRPLAKV